MASTYTTNTGIEKPGSGEQSGTWGTTTNNNFDIIDRAINGVGSITLSGTTTTLTTSDGALSDGGYKVLILGGSPSGTNTITITPNDQSKVYLVFNNTNQTATFTQGSGANANVPAGKSVWIFADGAGSGAIVRAVSTELINDTSPQLSANLDLNSNDITGTGNISLTGNITNTGTATLTTADNLAQLTLVSTDTDADSGPNLTLKRNGDNGADADDLGIIQFQGKDDGGTNSTFASITSEISDATASSKGSRLRFFTLNENSSIQQLRLGPNSVVFNEGGADIDFRVEGDTNANLIKTDADNNRVGIGKDPTQGLLDINGDAYATNYYGNGSNLTGIHVNQALISTVGTDSNTGSNVIVTRTITPTSTSSKILLMGNMGMSSNDSNVSIELKRDSTFLVGSLQRGDGNETIGSGATNAAQLSLSTFFIDSPNTTSQVSYTLVSDRTYDSAHNANLIAIEISS